jgi:uncharacterized protein YbjT (DUF2867 family)
MDILTILVVGANGSIGRHVVAQALEAGHTVRALVRRTSKALPVGAVQVIGDLTDPASLVQAVEGVDAIVFTHGSDGEGKVGARTVDYGGVRNILAALPAGARPRIALMTAIGVTDRVGHYNRETEAHDWKRRAERLVRASGLAYTIVRPGWFDYNKPDEMRIVMLQGDRRHAGDSSDGVIARSQVAQVLLASLTCDDARCRSFELVAERGPAQEDLAPLFAALQPDDPAQEDGPDNLPNMPISDEPAEVLADLASVRAR